MSTVAATAGRRPRVLVLTSTLPARPGDGTPEFVLTLAQGLADEFPVTIVAPRVPGAPRRQQLDGVEIRRFAYFPRRWEGLADGAILANLARQPWRVVEVPSLLAAMFWTASRVARGQRPGLVHAHWIVPAGMVGALVRRRWRIPMVLTVHGADMYGVRGRVYRWLRPRLVASADVVTPVSTDLARSLGMPEADWADRVVPMGVDTAAIRAAVGPRDADPRRFLFVGRLAEKKGLDVLLRAVSRVEDAQLVVAGGGPEGDDLRRLARELGVADRVDFRGQLSKEELWVEFRTAGAVVIPSRVARSGDREGTPVVLAEAAAAGIPVIASTIGGLAERIHADVDGVLVPPEDEDALATVLDKAIANPTWLESLARQAQDTLAEELDIRHTTARYRAFYEAALGADVAAGGNRRA